MKRAKGRFVTTLISVRRRGARRRWRDAKRRQTYDEDTQHGELEKYNRKLRHMGTVDPATGEITKPPVTRASHQEVNRMTALDMIKLGILQTHEAAEEFAEALVDKWHEDLIPGDLHDVLGLTPREYQAWTTGGVSLLTIARWHKTSHPPLDPSKPWFRTAGKPGVETVGYLSDVTAGAKSAPRETRKQAPPRPIRRK